VATACLLGAKAGGRPRSSQAAVSLKASTAAVATKEECACAVEEVQGAAPALVRKLWIDTGFPREAATAAEVEKVWTDACSPSAVIEDTYRSADENGSILDYIRSKAKAGTFVVDEVADGDKACGFMWHLQGASEDEVGLRGTTFVSLDEEGRLDFLCEVAEPLFKPGDVTITLLKEVGGGKVMPTYPYTKRVPAGASEVTKYLWEEVNQGGSDVDEVVKFFATDVFYEDFNYEEPMRGISEVRAFLDKFVEIKALRLVPDRFSDGKRACCFTWHVEIAGVPEDAQRIGGISFYRLNDAGKIDFVRDIPESALKPPPLQALAAAVRPDVRVFQTRPKVKYGPGEWDCEVLPDGSALVVGERVEAPMVRAVEVTGEDGVLRSLGDIIDSKGGSASSPAVVIFLRHLG